MPHDLDEGGISPYNRLGLPCMLLVISGLEFETWLLL